MLRKIIFFSTELKMLFDPSQLFKYTRRSSVIDIPQTERQSLRDDHLSISLVFFNLPLGIGFNDGRRTNLCSHPNHYVLPVPGLEHRSSVFLAKYIHQAAVAYNVKTIVQ